MGSHAKWGRVLAVCLLAGASIAKAGPGDDALIDQVKQLASQGQDAQTTAQVNQYVDENRDAISAIIKEYANYLGQAQAMTANDETAMPGTSQTTPAGTVQKPETEAGTAAGNGRQTSGLQPAPVLQISGVQASGGLRTAHLQGYPALPDVEPVTSVTQPTAAQIEYAARVEKEMQARKKYLMEHPEGYTY